MEIGPGSGLLVDLILKNFNLKKVYLIDLPEVIAYCFIYLSYINPEIDISLPNEPHMRQTSLISFYIPNQIDEIGEFNLMCNTASFEEMNKSVISKYFKFMREKCEEQNIFYCFNRVEKFMKNSDDSFNQTSIPIRFAEYDWMEKDETYSYNLNNFIKIYTNNPFFSKSVKLSKK